MAVERYLANCLTAPRASLAPGLGSVAGSASEDGWEDALLDSLWSAGTDAEAHVCVAVCAGQGYGSKVPAVVWCRFWKAVLGLHAEPRASSSTRS